MPTTISFLRNPDYGTSVVLFLLSPAGLTFDAKEIGRNLYGRHDYEIEAITIPGLAPRNRFRFSEIPVHWTDFLELSFSHADHALFYIPGKQRFQEISKESLLQQNPDLYSFSFYRFTCEDYVPEKREEERIEAAARGVAPPPATVADANAKPADTASGGIIAEKVDRSGSNNGQEHQTRDAEAQLLRAQEALHSLIDAGWSANAVSRVTGISPITLGSIRKKKQSTVSDRVHDTLMQLKADFTSGKVGKPSRKKQITGFSSQSASEKARAKSPTGAVRTSALDSGSRTSRTSAGDHGRRSSDAAPRYIAVDADKLASFLDRLITTFSDAINDLRSLDGAIRKQDSEL